MIPGIKTEVPRNQWSGAAFFLAANNRDRLQLPVVKLLHGCQDGEVGVWQGEQRSSLIRASHCHGRSWRTPSMPSLDVSCRDAGRLSAHDGREVDSDHTLASLCLTGSGVLLGMTLGMPGHWQPWRNKEQNWKEEGGWPEKQA